MKPLLSIRADASEAIGHGHVFRCLALAHAWRAFGGRVVFYSHRMPAALRRRLHAEGFRLCSLRRALSTRWVPAEGWIVLDGYHFPSAYPLALRRRGARLLVLADAPIRSQYPADLVVDQNEGSQWSGYVLPFGTLLAGVRYALLRPEFWTSRPGAFRAHPDRVLVTAGGSDVKNLMGRTLAELNGIRPRLNICLIVGSSNPRREFLARLAAQSHHRVRIAWSPANLAPFFRWTDIGVSAAGGTALELARMGIPSILCAVTENQLVVTRALKDIGAALVLPGYSRLRRGAFALAVKRLLHDVSLRRRLSHNGRRFVDGQGALRVVRLMKALSEDRPIDARIRLAREEDSAAIWHLSNHPWSRATSFSKNPIPIQTHRRWYRRTLGSRDCRIWLMELDGTVIGQARYEVHDSRTADVSISVAAAFSGRGVGTKLLRQTSRLACRALGARQIRARILPKNKASIRIFSKAGYQFGSKTQHKGRSCLEYFWRA